MLLSPHTTRSTSRPVSVRVSSSPRSRRRATLPGPSTTPGCTTAILTAPALCGRGAHAATAATDRPHTTSSAPAAVRAARSAISRTAPVFTATTSRLTSHTPPTEASRRAGPTSHWLAPRSPHGPPSPSQDRTSSIISQPEGTTSTAAAPARRTASRRAAGLPAAPREPTAARAARPAAR
ncbi:hypothetical protein ID875_25180 [Streptomyces globisporus]|uniref:Uncharacterized protein n=1 Tax=Streptomyces globisporus TaxID=1908 RepID=A0A927GPS8_STRGL|nr:hypothetical protein [Streptomyces globisporus]